MTVFFMREYALTVGNVKITGLDVDFKVKKSTKREPNKAEITVFNLSPDRIKEISSSRDVRVVLEAGYKTSGMLLLFRGDVRNAGRPKGDRISGGRSSETDRILKIEAEDSGSSVLRSRVSRSFPPGTEVYDVLLACIDAMGIGRGNVNEFQRRGLEGAGPTFAEGATLSGWAYQETDNLVKSMGLRWSVQNGVFQLQERNKPLQTTAVLLNRGSGLVGTPTADNKGIVSATSLIQGGLDPGRKVVLESEDISGGFEVRTVTYSGSTSSQNWYAEMELRPY